ncbi:MAG: universal stress protein [Geminicoccaceae bacterium]
MSYRSVLVPMGDETETRLRLSTAIALAKRFDSHVTALFVAPSPTMVVSDGFVGAYMPSDVIEAQRRAYAEQAEKTRKLVDDMLGGAGISHDWLSLEGDPGRLVTTQARACDLVILSKPRRPDLDDWFASGSVERVILNAGVPALVVPVSKTVDAFGARVLLGWNGSRECRRALTEGLPLMHLADQVGLLAIDADDQDGELPTAHLMVDRLRQRGIKAEAVLVASEGLPVEEVILSQVNEYVADSLILGAYSHSRLRELVLGGVSRRMLSDPPVPVLLAY